MTWQSHASIRKGRWKVTYGHVLDMALTDVARTYTSIRKGRSGDRVRQRGGLQLSPPHRRRVGLQCGAEQRPVREVGEQPLVDGLWTRLGHVMGGVLSR